MTPATRHIPTTGYRIPLFLLGCVTILAPSALAMDPYLAARLRGLDKITGVAEDFVLGLNQTAKRGAITVTLRACWQAPPEDEPETSAYLEIKSAYGQKQASEVFSGWMFASSPGLNALEHPVYDVWVINCTTSAPENWDGDWEKSADNDSAAPSRR